MPIQQPVDASPIDPPEVSGSGGPCLVRGKAIAPNQQSLGHVLAAMHGRAVAIGQALTLGKSIIAAFVVASIAVPCAATGLHTANQFAVSESGAATLTIPIQVPRGIGGMEPQLALNYSSAAGNGLLGIGWTLSGPSAITRCPKTKALDGDRGAVTFGADDRYCLDGQRLVLVNAGPYGASGSEYRTERDTFSRITADGTYAGQPTVPNSFRVETKAGLILYFGLGANSQVLTNFVSGVSTPATINRWMLQRIADRHGSFVEYVYCRGEVSADGTSCTTATSNWSGSTVVHYIRYTNRGGAVNGQFSVLFGYEGRPDAVQGFHAGSAARQIQRMKTVTTYRDFGDAATSGGVTTVTPGKVVRAYDIAYEAIASETTSLRATNTSRIAQIQERDAAGNTLAPLSFSLAPDLVFGQSVAQQGTVVISAPVLPFRCGGVINGRLPLQCP